MKENKGQREGNFVVVDSRKITVTRLYVYTAGLSKHVKIYCELSNLEVLFFFYEITLEIN